MEFIRLSVIAVIVSTLMAVGFTAARAAGDASTAENNIEKKQPASEIKIKWYGQAMFLVELGGVRALIDPFDEKLGYALPPAPINCDILIQSHGHFDHANTKIACGTYELKKSEGASNVRGIGVTQIKCFHDKSQGKERGENLITVLEFSNVRIAHFGDLGHIPDKDLAKKIGKIDIALIPVGGIYTIDAFDAWEVVRLLSPSIIIPMHYKTEKLDPKLPLSGVDKFIAGRKNIVKPDTCEYGFDPFDMPKDQQIILFPTPGSGK